MSDDNASSTVEQDLTWSMLRALEDAIERDDVRAVQTLLHKSPSVLSWRTGIQGDGIPPPITTAARLGRNGVLAVLLDHREDAAAPLHNDKQGPWGTLLTEACRAGHVDTVRLLLARMPDADINEYDNLGRTPLLAVAEGSYRWAAESFSDEWAAAEDGPTAEEVARRNAKGEAKWRKDSQNRVELIQLLLTRGADPRAQQMRTEHIAVDDISPFESMQESSMRSASRGGNALAMVLKREDGGSDPAVLAALVQGGVDIHQTHRADVSRLDGTGLCNASVDRAYEDDDLRRYDEEDCVGLTPLGVAALYHNTAGIEALLQCASDAGIDTTNDHLTASSCPDTMPPLHAAMTGRPFMSSWGAVAEQLHVTDDEAIAIHTAAMERAVATVHLLTRDETVCAATIDATHTDILGRAFTPLHLAARFDRLPLLQALLDRGADPSIRLPTKEGHSILFSVFSSLWWISPAPSLTAYRAHTAATMHAADAAVDMHALVGDLLRGLDEEVVNEADADGNTALHWAMGYGLVNEVGALMAHGARADAQNKAGEVPLEGRMPTTSQPQPW